MFEIIFELGCRVGEFVLLQAKHINFNRSEIYIPAEITKTKHSRISVLPKGLANEIKSMLKQRDILNKRDGSLKNPDAYIFQHGKRRNKPYTPNRIRQIFQKYIQKAGLQQFYGKDKKGRNLKMFTVHSLRHSHAQYYIIDKKLPLPIVQKQLGHRNLKTTSIYLQPSSQKIAKAYSEARNQNCLLEQNNNF
jgi:integrase